LHFGATGRPQLSYFEVACACVFESENVMHFLALDDHPEIKGFFLELDVRD